MGKKRILLVDDEPIVTRTLALYLEDTGKYEVRTVNDGTLAVQAARDFRPDMILLDVVLPEVDGPEIAAQVRQDEMVKDTPIVFLTALVKRMEVGPRGKDIGGYPFMAKPLDPDRVVECIERHTGAPNAAEIANDPADRARERMVNAQTKTCGSPAGP